MSKSKTFLFDIGTQLNDKELALASRIERHNKTWIDAQLSFAQRMVNRGVDIHGEKVLEEIHKISDSAQLRLTIFIACNDGTITEC